MKWRFLSEYAILDTTIRKEAPMQTSPPSHQKKICYTKLKKSKQEDFYNEHTAEIILFESAKKYLKEHLGESKSLTMSKWKSEVTALKKEKDSLYSQIIDLRKEVEQAESVRSCIEQLQQECRELSQVKKQELDL